MRRLTAVGALSLGFALACSGVGDMAMNLVADQAEKVLAEALNVSPDDVEITAMDNGRWRAVTPDWKATCGLGADAKTAKGSPFQTGSELMADCKLDADCTEVFGVPCEGEPVSLGVTVYAAGDGGDLEAKRTKELEGKGMRVIRTEEDKSVILTGAKGKKPRAVAVIGTGDQGSRMEVLITR